MTGTELVFAQASLTERIRWAREISSAGQLVPAGFRDGNQPNPAKILLAVETGAMLGLHPMAALNGIHVIDGKPTLSAALMSALVHRAGHRLRVTTRGKVTTTGQGLGGDYEVTATLVRHDDPDNPFVIVWTIDRARRAGLWGAGNWRKYPENQMQWRAISEAARVGAPEVLLGVWYTPDELGAQVDEDGAPVDITATAVDRTETPKRGRLDPEQVALQASNAETATELRELYKEARAAGILGEPLTTGVMLGEVLLERGEALAAAEAQAASGEPEYEPMVLADVPDVTEPTV